MTTQPPYSQSLGRTPTSYKEESGMPEGDIAASSIITDKILYQARERSQAAALLADVVFGRVSYSLKSNPSARPYSFPIEAETDPKAVEWFPISALTRLEICAHLVAMFKEPDGIRLVRTAISVLEHLGLTSIEDISISLQMRVPELFAVPLVHPNDDVLLLLRHYFLTAAPMTNRPAQDSAQGPQIHVSCGNCGHDWPLVNARTWIHFESFVYGLGCPSCQTNFITHAAEHESILHES